VEINEKEGFDETAARDTFALALLDTEEVPVFVCPFKEYEARNDRLAVSVLLKESEGCDDSLGEFVIDADTFEVDDGLLDVEGIEGWDD